MIVEILQLKKEIMGRIYFEKNSFLFGIFTNPFRNLYKKFCYAK